MYNPAEYLFFRLVQKANASQLSPWNLAEFLQEKEFKIQRVGRLLQFLGLADRTENGWAANHRLMSIIAEQLTRQSRQSGKVTVTDDDRAFLDSLYEFATRAGVDLDDHDYDNDEEEEERYAANWCWNVLAALGLIKKRDGKHWGFKPTTRLKDLFESVPVVKERIEHIKRMSAQNILHLNTRDPEVRDSSTPSAVPPQSDRMPFKPAASNRTAPMPASGPNIRKP